MKPGRFFSSLATEELIALSPSLVQIVLDTIPTGVQVLKSMRNEQGKIVDFKYILINDHADDQSQVGKTFLSINSQNKDLFHQLVKAVNSQPANGSLSTFGLDGSARWFHIRYVKFGDGVLLSTEDITDKKMLNDRSRENQHLFQQIAESSPDIVYIMDIDTQVVIYTNRPIAAELGYSKHQIAHMKNPLMDTMDEDDALKMKVHLGKIKTIADDVVLEIEHRMKTENGTIKWYCTRTSVFKRNKSGIPIEMLGISQNITTRKRQEEQNHLNLNLLKQAEEISVMGTWVYEPASEKFTWSEGMYKLFNLPLHSEVRPEIYLDFVPPKEYSRAWTIIEKIKNTETFEESLHLMIPGKEQKTIETKAITIRDKEGRPIKCAGVDRDITKEVELEERITKLNENLVSTNYDLATANMELKTIGSIALNDFKETLKHLYTNLELIATHDAPNFSSAGKANIRRTQAAIQKMKLLTEDITMYLAIQSEGSKSLVDMNELLAAARKYAGNKLKEENLQVNCNDLPVLKGYPTLLSLLFHHLLDNALKFRQPGRNAIIQIGCTEKDGAELNHPAAIAAKRYYVISVADNGMGFSPEHAQPIFGLFYRVPVNNAPKGSGMGLAICKKIMDLHGGFISAESTPGKGSSFFCYFPIESINFLQQA